MDSDADAQVYRFTWWEVLVFALMGCVAGLLGSAFVKMHMWVHRTGWSSTQRRGEGSRRPS